ncbi:MAG: hypothetical protein FAF04_01930 [Epsilonproteobacteria bacterium]|nr:hypothetical protein [Campylobacterota bacterium]
MIKYLLILILPLSLFASQILSYNIYDRTDRVDLMITFDTPYHGTIKQSRNNSKIIIKLENASIESPKIKKVASRFLQSLAITPLKNETRIIATVPKSVRLIASKTSDGYGLRLRFTSKSALTQSPAAATTAQQNASTTGLPTKQGNDLSRSYTIVIAILIIGILILFYIKKKTTPKQLQKAAQQQKQQKTPWLFNTTSQPQTQETATQAAPAENANSVSIRFQKAIDAHNSVVMLDFGKESYLVLMGNSNILLDKFHENRPTSQQEFESILQSRHEELENFLNNNDTATANTEKEPLQAYKERAASIIYNDEF